SLTVDASTAVTAASARKVRTPTGPRRACFPFQATLASPPKNLPAFNALEPTRALLSIAELDLALSLSTFFDTSFLNNLFCCSLPEVFLRNFSKSSLDNPSIFLNTSSYIPLFFHCLISLVVTPPKRLLSLDLCSFT